MYVYSIPRFFQFDGITCAWNVCRTLVNVFTTVILYITSYVYAVVTVIFKTVCVDQRGMYEFRNQSGADLRVVVEGCRDVARRFLSEGLF